MTTDNGKRGREVAEEWARWWMKDFFPKATQSAVDQFIQRNRGIEGFIAKALDAAEERGRESACEACRGLVIVGTDGCRSCETGRVTMYTQGRHCVECLHTMESERARKGEGDGKAV